MDSETPGDIQRKAFDALRRAAGRSTAFPGGPAIEINRYYRVDAVLRRFRSIRRQQLRRDTVAMLDLGGEAADYSVDRFDPEEVVHG